MSNPNRETHAKFERLLADQRKSGFANFGGFKRYALFSVCVAASCMCHALVNWTGMGNDWDFANSKNWQTGMSPYNGSDECTSGKYDPQIALNVSGHYLLHEDLTLIRAVADKNSNDKECYFDFDDGKVLTLRGLANGSAAFGMNGGENVLFALTGGTILVPEAHCSANAYGSRISYPRGDKVGERTTNVTFAVYNRPGGGTASLMTPLLRLNWGARNLFVVSNNASAVVGTLDLGQGNNALSNGVIVSSGGSLALTNSTGTLQLGGGSNSVGVHFTVADGGVLSGVQCFYFGSTQGHLLAFRGNGTDVTMTSENTCNKVASSSCRIEVTGGAKFTMKGSQGRIWAGAAKNNVSNTVYVAGAGSRLVCEGTGSFFGTAQNSCGNSLCVTDGAYAEFKRFHLGQHSGCNGNVCVVENNGVLVDKENDASSEAKCMVIGFGEGGVFAVSNRLLVASGGIVSNYVLSVGVSTNSVGNSVEIDGGEMYTGKDVYVARAGEASRLTVKNNGSIFIENLLTTAGADDFTNSVGVALSKKHEIEVLSGGTLSASSFTCRGADHKVTVSNGLFEVRGTGGFQLPYWSGGDGGSELVLAGTNPVVRSATAYNAGNYALAFRGSGRLRFVVPEFGYAQPPLQTTQGRLGLFNKAGSETCVFDVSACNPNRRISTVIAKAGTESDRLFVTDDWLERTRAALPEGARLEHKGNTLVFSYGSDGTVIIFR